MKLTLATLKFTENPELKNFAREKVAKLYQHYPEIIRIDVTLKVGAKNNPTNKWCELYVSIPGENKFTKRSSESFEDSILKALEVMHKILEKSKLD